MNSEQRLAVTAPNGYVQIIAGPGTGKTFTLLNRLNYLLDSGLSAEHVIVISFTNQAADEIKRRIADKGKGQPFVGTFHKIAIVIMRKYGGFNFSIAGPQDQRSILQKIVEDADVDALNLYPKSDNGAATRTTSQVVNTLLSRISKIKSSTSSVPEDQPIHAVLTQYNTELERRNMLDFDDILLKLCFYTSENPPSEIGRKVQDFVRTIQGVLVDEFQDTSEVQLRIAEYLSKVCENLTVVGDPDQSIYGFRNANMKNFSLLQANHPDGHVYFLSRNYRSTDGILSLAEQTIKKSSTRLFNDARKVIADTTLKSAPMLIEGGKRPPQVHYTAMANQIERLIAAGVKPQEIAVLARQRSHLRFLEASLVSKRILVRVVGGVGLASRTCIIHITDYLRVTVSGDDDMAIARVINVPKRGLGEAALKRLRGSRPYLTLKVLESSSEKGAQDFLNVISNCREMCASGAGLSTVVSYIRSVLWPQGLNDTEEPLVEAFSQSCENVSSAHLAEFLDNWALGHAKRESRAESVTLSTLHSAKGLEWPVVYVIINENLNRWELAGGDERDEETRLLYVGMTRACAHLTVLSIEPHPVIPAGAKKTRSIDLAMPSASLLSAYLKRKIELKRPTVGDDFVGFIPASELPCNSEPIHLRGTKKRQRHLFLSETPSNTLPSTGVALKKKLASPQPPKTIKSRVTPAAKKKSATQLSLTGFFKPAK